MALHFEWKTSDLKNIVNEMIADSRTTKGHLDWLINVTAFNQFGSKAKDIIRLGEYYVNAFDQRKLGASRDLNLPFLRRKLKDRQLIIDLAEVKIPTGIKKPIPPLAANVYKKPGDLFYLLEKRDLIEFQKEWLAASNQKEIIEWEGGKIYRYACVNKIPVVYLFAEFMTPKMERYRAKHCMA